MLRPESGESRRTGCVRGMLPGTEYRDAEDVRRFLPPLLGARDVLPLLRLPQRGRAEGGRAEGAHTLLLALQLLALRHEARELRPLPQLSQVAVNASLSDPRLRTCAAGIALC